MNVRSAAPLIPPRPQVPESLGWFRFFAAVRTNALTMWPAAAYEKDVLAGPTMPLKSYLINTPDAIHRVLVENIANYRRTAVNIRIFWPIIGNGLLLSEGDDWRHQRRTIAPALAPRIIPMLVQHIASAIEETVVHLAAGPRHAVDLVATMEFLTLEIVARSMFSLEMGQYGDAMRRMMQDFGEKYGQPHFLDLMLPAAIPTLRDLGRRRFRRRWIALMDEIVAARQQAPPSNKPRDLFDMLLAARDPESGAAFSREQLRDQMATMIVAGYETTALTLFWSLYLLALAPADQERVAEEARDLDLGPENAAQALPKLVYTRAVINEALRLYPPGFTIARRAKGPDKLGEVAIPRDSLVLIAPWVLHRHVRLWEAPDAFIPSRFLGAEPPRFSYLPFGGGPRVCIGAQLALTEAVLVLAAMVKRFRISLADAVPVFPVGIILVHPDHAPPFRLQNRN